jgi:hypothetical protein
LANGDQNTEYCWIKQKVGVVNEPGEVKGKLLPVVVCNCVKAPDIFFKLLLKSEFEQQTPLSLFEIMKNLVLPCEVIACDEARDAPCAEHRLQLEILG